MTVGVTDPEHPPERPLCERQADRRARRQGADGAFDVGSLTGSIEVFQYWRERFGRGRDVVTLAGQEQCARVR